MTTTETHTGNEHIRGDTGLDVVTGAFSYSGRAIAEELMTTGRQVRTLTGHPERARAEGPIQACPLGFADLPGLVRSLEGATTLYNTYWVRFDHRRTTHQLAVDNSRVLFHAARRAGVQRIVHISITNAAADSPYPYFQGKAAVERALMETGLSYAVLRPAILFGRDGVLINNIAWLLRRLPVFAVGGHGDYRIRPIHVQDLARLAAEEGRGRQDVITDAVGPERPTFMELVEWTREAVGSRSRILRVPGRTLPVLARVLSRGLGDVLLTREEYLAMSDNLADSTAPATGPTAISSWLTLHGSTLGQSYANELDRHYRAA